MRRLTPLLVIALVSVLPACGGQGQEAERDENGEQTDPAAEERAERAVLMLEDLPPGWREVARPDDEEGIEDVEECEALAEAGETELLATAESPSFESDDAQIESTVSVYESASRADAVMEAWGDADNRSCFEAAFREAIQEEAREDPRVAAAVQSVEIGRMSVEARGDESLGWQMRIDMEVDGFGIDVFLDIAMVRVGDAIAQLSFVKVFSPLGDGRDEAMDAVVHRLGATG